VRILIDECLPIQLRTFFPGHDAVTVMHLGWRSLRNGELLARAEADAFDVFLTADAGIPISHDIAGGHLAIVVVPTNRRSLLLTMEEPVRNTVEQAAAGECLFISLDGKSVQRR
jgi:predicted nuclease of predicted toxin-antitoxin system